MYEKSHHGLLSRPAFISRLTLHVVVAFGLIAASLYAGMLGYHELEGLSWLDAALNASMILGGMGPVDPIKTEAGKLFATAYALYSGLLFLVTAAIVFAPMVHRLLHRFHMD